jgi:ribosomal protein L7Ae-like RNA K-turn-binding protein
MPPPPLASLWTLLANSPQRSSFREEFRSQRSTNPSSKSKVNDKKRKRLTAEASTEASTPPTPGKELDGDKTKNSTNSNVKASARSNTNANANTNTNKDKQHAFVVLGLNAVTRLLERTPDRVGFVLICKDGGGATHEGSATSSSSKQQEGGPVYRLMLHIPVLCSSNNVPLVTIGQSSDTSDSDGASGGSGGSGSLADVFGLESLLALAVCHPLPLNSEHADDDGQHTKTTMRSSDSETEKSERVRRCIAKVVESFARPVHIPWLTTTNDDHNTNNNNGNKASIRDRRSPAARAVELQPSRTKLFSISGK